jgi:DNA-binding NtrC family response regulator
VAIREKAFVIATNGDATKERPPRILIADDQSDVLEALRLMLKGRGFEIELARSVAEILSAVETRALDAILMDLNYSRDTTSGTEGLDILPRLQAADHTMAVIVMTAWGSVDSAVEAMRRGAWDYIEKPWDNARLLTTVNSQLELSRALRRSQRLEGENEILRGDGAPEIIADSPRMRPVLELMARVGPSDANVLIGGEHGTGKELAARWMHAISSRRNHAFVAVNMGGLSEGVFESELFGHVKGSFTDAKSDRMGRFELADRGTLFLDEIGNLPLHQQSKLLRVLQAGEVERVGDSRPRQVNVRVLAATNVDLHAEVAAGRFREDLLFRLNTIEIQLPPLRERRDDVAPLANYFLRKHATRYGKPLTSFDNAAMQALLEHPWPGNIRELDHVVERAVLLAQGEQVRAIDLALRATASTGTRADEVTLEEAERVLIQKALSRYDGNVSHAAKALGISRSALYRRLAVHGL